MGFFGPKHSFALATSLGLLCASSCNTVLAANFYDLGSFDDTYTQSIDTTTTPPERFWAGFTFQIAPGYQATYSKLGVWLKDIAVSKIYNKISLYDITGVTDQSSGLQIFDQVLQKGSSCTVSDGVDRNDYCIGNALTQQTLTSGKTYALLASYSQQLFGPTIRNENYSWAANLEQSAFSTASNVIFGVPYFSEDNITFTQGSSALSFFGPNLVDFQVTAVPSGTGVPSPMPIFGSIAAFSWSRSLRKKISMSS